MMRLMMRLMMRRKGQISIGPTTLGVTASVIALVLGGPALAVVTSTTTHGILANDLDSSISNSDILHGLIATELPGDMGWHPANPAADDSLDPNGLPAFTDGFGINRAAGTGNLYGLLNDFPGEGVPAKLLQYDLPSATDLERIHIFTGNDREPEPPDGRVYSTTVIRYSTNNGANYTQLGYFQSDPSGTRNLLFGDPELGEIDANVTLVEIFDDTSSTMIAGVTNLQIDFYAVDNTGGQMRDPYDGVNPFTGVDDELTFAIVSPLVWEIDVFGQEAAFSSADFDQDGDIDGADFLAWQEGYGTTGTATLADGDANDDKNVNTTDLEIWQAEFGDAAATTTWSAVPEPSTLTGLFAGLLAGMGLLRAKRY
jgi:hypothetical protein